MLSWGSIQAFGSTEIQEVGEPTSTVVLGESLLGRFVVPFEVVSFLLLAALIGGITLARKDLTPAEEEAADQYEAFERSSVKRQAVIGSTATHHLPLVLDRRDRCF